MGCGSSTSKSKAAVLNGSTHKMHLRNKSEVASVSDDELTMANETLRMRQERDQQVFKEIQAEKAALRAIASVMIEQRSSCENLLDLMDSSELETLKQDLNSHKLQKAAAVKIANQQADKKKRWAIYNNVEALDTHSIEQVAEFMTYAIMNACEDNTEENQQAVSVLSRNTAQNSTTLDEEFPSVPELSRSPSVVESGRRMSVSVADRNVVYEYGSSPSSSPQRITRRKSMRHSMSGKFSVDNSDGLDSPMSSKSTVQPISLDAAKEHAKEMPSSSKLSSNKGSKLFSPGGKKRAVSKAGDVDPDLKRQLLSMNILTVTPQSTFSISEANIFDYDFPPGLVTIGVAATVIELFKRGGRLTPRSVHKLLRLGYRSFKGRPNTTRIQLGPTDRITVVGDIHGQLSDLLHIIDSCGLPSSSNRYLFNGDFVDRGAYGVEVMCVLLVLHAAMPEYVTMNRGNHEDYAICTAYGFQVECFEKYGELIFGMFVEVFQQIPLFAVINDAVFVLHGGLFHTKDALLSELNAIKRTTFSLEDLPEGGEGITEVPRFKRQEYLKQLVRDALWSDPVDRQGTHPSIRGAGVGFGPDITRIFLNTNKLKFVVRSHECVRTGYNEPYTGENQPLLCTIFSASDYGSSGNSAAYMIFRVNDTATSSSLSAAVGIPSPDNVDEIPIELSPHSRDSRSPSVVSCVAEATGQEELCSMSEVKYVRNCNLCYTVHYFYIDAEYRDGEHINDLHRNDIHSSLSDKVYSRDAYLVQYGKKEMSAINSNSNSNSEAKSELSLSIKLPDDTNGSNGLGLTDIVVLDEVSGHKKLKRQSSHDLALSSCSDEDTILVGLSISLYELILERKYAMQEVFAVLDPKGEGVVTKSQFSMVLHDVLCVPIQWIRLLQVLLEEQHFKMHHGKRLIDYAAFLNQFLELTTVPKEEPVVEPVADPNEDALNRYLKAMEKATCSSEKVAKKPDETVKASRTSSASAIDVSHHLKNVSQFDKFSPGRVSASTTESLGKPFRPSAPKLKPLDVPGKPAIDPFASANSENVIVSLSSLTSTLPAGKESEEEEGNCFHQYLVTEELLDVLYTDFLQLEETFKSLDRGAKGYINKDDLEWALKQLKETVAKDVTLPTAEELMRALDIHDSGKVDMNLFFEMNRISDMTLNAHIDDDESDDEVAPTANNGLSRDASHDNLSRVRKSMNASTMQMMSAAGTHSPTSPTHHHATGVRNDSHSSLAIKGVNINVDELTTSTSPPVVAEQRCASPKPVFAAVSSEDIGLNMDI